MTTSQSIKTAVALSAMVLGPFAASAAITLTAEVGGGAIAGTQKFNFDLVPLGSASAPGVVGTGGATVDVSFVPDAEAVTGFSNGEYARPYLSGDNGKGFGPGGTDQVPIPGANASTYLTTGKGSVILEFPMAHNYLGLLWGSIDDYNTLTFYYQDNPLPGGVVNTEEFSALEVDPNGDQNINGTKYVNIWSTLAFDKVVATSGNYAFEFDNVAVPEPSTYIAGGLALLPLLFGLRARWNKKA